MNKKGVFLLLSSLLIYFYPPAAAEAGVTIDFTVQPKEPQNYQPFFEGNQPARAIVEVRDAATDNSVNDVRIELNITHIKGKGILSTGFPYLEGKETLGGKFFAPEGKLELEYLFPIRGNYQIEVLAAPTSSSPLYFEPFSEVFSVHVKEPFYEVRNAVLLTVFLFLLGAYLGRIYAKAVAARGGR